LWDLKLPLLLNAVKASRSCEDGVSSQRFGDCIYSTSALRIVWEKSVQLYFIIGLGRVRVIVYSSSSGSTVRYGPWPLWWSSRRHSTMTLLSITLHLLRHCQATLIWVFRFSESIQTARRLSFCKVSFPPFWLIVLAILTWLLLLLTYSYGFCYGSRVSSVSTTGWTTRRSGFDPRQGQRIFPLASGAHPAYCPMGTGGPFPGGKKRPGRDADHSPLSSAEVVNE
jgi:hypothetical protein